MPTEFPLTILVMGAGALGCVTGGFMAKDGHDVHLVGERTDKEILLGDQCQGQP